MSSTTFTVNGHRITVRTLQPEKPTGLMRVAWQQTGMDVTVVVDGERHDRVGSLIWTKSAKTGRPRSGWSLGSSKHWNTVNTLRYPIENGRCYHWADDGSALASMIRYIKANFEAGYPVLWNPNG